MNCFAVQIWQPGLDFPSIDSFDMLFICGGSMNVDQTHVHPWLIAEKEFIKSAIKNNKKMVGLCLGAQLIADVLGAKVNRHIHSEVGWHKVNLIPFTPVLSKFESLMVFQYHSYTFALPEGAQLIAGNSACSNQGFVLGKNILAFQFHPEASIDWIQSCAEDKDLPQGPYCQTAKEMIRDSIYQPPMQDWYFAGLDYLITT
ncbi:MAG: type 1 glutamine amidotransferase, partial [Pseudobdellovibrionaceae bacterium]